MEAEVGKSLGKPLRRQETLDGRHLVLDHPGDFIAFFRAPFNDDEGVGGRRHLWSPQPEKLLELVAGIGNVDMQTIYGSIFIAI